ncbi:hypothetical protein FRACYDRAFT_268545, partial [Fragilariopsis cylindrus CCMP1102]
RCVNVFFQIQSVPYCKNQVFIQPRDFVTYCRHRWLNNGRVQFITNQACEHTRKEKNNNKKKKFSTSRYCTNGIWSILA